MNRAVIAILCSRVLEQDEKWIKCLELSLEIVCSMTQDTDVVKAIFVAQRATGTHARKLHGSDALVDALHASKAECASTW